MEEINGLKILSGVNTHPGSGSISNHTSEIEIFSNILNNIDNKNNPIMIEIITTLFTVDTINKRVNIP
jgi:hypothetical protein